MAETLKAVAKLCPTIKRVILFGPNQEGCVSYQEMVQDSAEFFNDTIDVSLISSLKYAHLNITSYLSLFINRSISTKIFSFFLTRVALLVSLFFILNHIARFNFKTKIQYQLYRTAKECYADSLDSRQKCTAVSAPRGYKQPTCHRYVKRIDSFLSYLQD